MSVAERSGGVRAVGAGTAGAGTGEGRSQSHRERSASRSPTRTRGRLAACLARAGRLGRIAASFAYFGVGGLFLASVVIPLQVALLRLRGRADEADLRAQRTLHRGARSFVRLAERLGLVRVRWEGAEALAAGPVLVVANHPSLIDTPLLMARMPQADFVASPSWSRNPWLRRAVAAAGYLRAERGAAVVEEAAARLRSGRSVVVYPEGSRTPPDGLRRFQRGAAHIALASGFPILPVRIGVTPRVLMKGQRLRDYPARAPEWRIEVGAPIRADDVRSGSQPRPLAARKLTGILHEQFEARWDRGEL